MLVKALPFLFPLLLLFSLSQFSFAELHILQKADNTVSLPTTTVDGAFEVSGDFSIQGTKQALKKANHVLSSKKSSAAIVTTDLTIDPFTFEMWFLLEETGSFLPIISYYSDRENSLSVIYRQGSILIHFQDTKFYANPNAPIKLNTWHFISVSYDPSAKMTVALDFEVLVAPQSVFMANQTAGGFLILSQEPDGTLPDPMSVSLTQQSSVLVDDMALYNKAFTDLEAMKLRAEFGVSSTAIEDITFFNDFEQEQSLKTFPSVVGPDVEIFDHSSLLEEVSRVSCDSLHIHCPGDSFALRQPHQDTINLAAKSLAFSPSSSYDYQTCSRVFAGNNLVKIVGWGLMAFSGLSQYPTTQITVDSVYKRTASGGHISSGATASASNTLNIYPDVKAIMFNGYSCSVTGSFVFQLNVWMRMTWTINTETGLATLFLNGAEEGSCSLAAANVVTIPDQNNFIVMLGSDLDGSISGITNKEFLNAEISTFAIYNKALTTEEINSLTGMRVMYFAQHLTTNVNLCDSLSSVTTNSGTFAPPTLKSMIPLRNDMAPQTPHEVLEADLMS